MTAAQLGGLFGFAIDAGVGDGDDMASLIHQASVTLNHDQVRLSPTTPIQVLAATENLNYGDAPTILPVPLWGSVTLNDSAGAYDNIDATCLFAIAWGSDVSQYCSSWISASLVAGTPAAKKVFPFLGLAVDVVTGTDAINATRQAGTGFLQDNALVFTCVNGALGNFTMGNALNNGRITVAYTNFNTATGVFS